MILLIKKHNNIIPASNLQEEKKGGLRGKWNGWLTTNIRFILKNCVIGLNMRKKYIRWHNSIIKRLGLLEQRKKCIQGNGWKINLKKVNGLQIYFVEINGKFSVIYFRYINSRSNYKWYKIWKNNVKRRRKAEQIVQ